MKRRSLKWRQLLAEHNNQLPPRNSKVKRYIRKGIPPELRGQVSKIEKQSISHDLCLIFFLDMAAL